MDLNGLTTAVSGSTGIAPDSVKKVLDAAFATITQQLTGEEPVKLQGLGTLARKPGKKDGKSRVVFRPQLTKAEKAAKKKKKTAKKAEAGE